MVWDLALPHKAQIRLCQPGAATCTGSRCWRLQQCRYAFGFGDKTTPDNSLGVNALLNGDISDNNPFIGTRYFALSDITLNQLNLFFC